MAGLLRAILRQIALLSVVALLMFLLMKASPVDPVAAYLGPALSHVSPEQTAQIRAAWGIDQPVWQQAWAWAGQLISGNAGYSTSHAAPVSEVLAARLPASLLLTGLAWLLSGLLGMALGLLAAAREGSFCDRAIRVYCYLLAATPTFWLAVLLLSLFSVTLGLTPICCAGPVGVPPDQVSAGQRLHHLALPLLCLTLFGVAQIALHSRARLLEVLRSDYVRLARAQGAGSFDILWRHGLRNAALPAVTVMMATLGELFGGSMLAEQVFSWPGLGRATVEAGLQGDVPLLLAIALLTALIVSTGNRLADALYRRIDRRMARL